MVFRVFIEYTSLFAVEADLLINAILSWGMNIQNNIIPVTSNNYIRYPTTNKF
jgi:uncharacterized protein (DUF486 family)